VRLCTGVKRAVRLVERLLRREIGEREFLRQADQLSDSELRRLCDLLRYKAGQQRPAPLKTVSEADRFKTSAVAKLSLPLGEMKLTRSNPTDPKLQLASSGGSSHSASDFTEDLADARGHTRHDRSGGNRDKASHQCVFDEVLAVIVRPDSQLPNQIDTCFHCPPASPLWSPKAGTTNQVKSLDYRSLHLRV
jgi:hypothetical protein